RHLVLESRWPEYRWKVVGTDTDMLGLTFGNADRGVAQRLADLALEIPDTGLARIVLNNVAERRVVDLGLLRREPVRLQLALHEIAAGDLQLLVLSVAREADDLHPVAQRSGDGVEHVGRGNEHDPAEIERHPEIIVPERVVLLRVEYLQQGRRRGALGAGAELVDLVQHRHAVARARLA